MNDLSVPLENDAEYLNGVSLVIRQQTAVQRLPGYSKTKHRIPAVNDRRSQDFVARLGEKLIRDDLDQAFARFREVLGLKRRDLKVTESDEGFGTIETPFFLYSNCVFQSDSDATDAIWQRDLSRIVDSNVLLEDGCNQLFANTFDSIEFVPSASINLEKLVDHVESLTDNRVSADYDRQLTYCKILITGSPIFIQVSKETFQVIHPDPTSPRELLMCIRDVRENLIDFTELT